MKRWVSVIATGILGGALALYGVNGLSDKYENFLLLISYWIGPWLAIVCVDFFLHPGQPQRSLRWRTGPGGDWPGLVAFLIGLAVSVPFMDSSLYKGRLAAALHGADIAYYVGIVVAGLIYFIFRERVSKNAQMSAKTPA